jgi:malate dehydrogenase
MKNKITVIGSGNVGAAAAQLIAAKGLADVVLVDRVFGLPQGKAQDICQAVLVAKQNTSVIGACDYEATAGSDIIVVTAGVAAKAGMSRSDLLTTNAGIVEDVVGKSAVFSPNAVFIIVSNPMDVMCHVALRASKLPPAQVIGMGGVLDSARFRRFISDRLGVDAQHIQAMVIGSHGEKMLPLPRYCTVAGIPLAQLLSQGDIEAVCRQTVRSGDEIVSLLKTGSAYHAPAACICEMAEAILRNQRSILPCAAWLTGQYGYENQFLGVPVILGEKGVETIIEIELTPMEQEQLDHSAAAVRELLNLLGHSMSYERSQKDPSGLEMCASSFAG